MCQLLFWAIAHIHTCLLSRSKHAPFSDEEETEKSNDLLKVTQPESNGGSVRDLPVRGDHTPPSPHLTISVSFVLVMI